MVLVYWVALDTDEILTRLAHDTFLSIAEQELAHDFLPTTKLLLTEISSQWVGYQLTKKELKQRAIKQLRIIATKCTELKA